MFENILMSIMLIILMIAVWFSIRERFVITRVFFLNDGNIVATVENSAGEPRDFIGPHPNWRGLDDDLKPPKRLVMQLNAAYLAWTKHNGY